MRDLKCTGSEHSEITEQEAQKTFRLGVRDSLLGLASALRSQTRDGMPLHKKPTGSGGLSVSQSPWFSHGLFLLTAPLGFEVVELV